VTYEAYVVSTTWTRPQVDSASSRFRTTRVFVRYMPLILQGKPVLLNKRDMFDADLNRLPPDEQEAVYAKMVPAPGRQGRQMFGVSVSPKKVSGPQLIRRYAHVSPTESDPIVNRPGMSGDSTSWEGWSHVRWFVEEVPAGAA